MTGLHWNCLSANQFAYVVSYFKSKNENIKVLDLFGEQPLKKELKIIIFG